MKPQETFSADNLLQQQIADVQNDYQKLLYTVSHDLAAPIRSVVAFSKLLQQKAQEKLEDKELHYLSFIISNGEKVQNMFLELLEHSRLVTRAEEHEEVDVNPLVKNILAENSKYIKEKGVIVQVDKLPTIYGEPNQLKKLFSALIDNAIKFRKPGILPHVLISADKYGKGWRFLVKDNGIGMEPKHADDIFTVFRRLHAESEYVGLGMGLAFAKRIMELHQGDIWVKSMPGKGSSFYFFFPNISELETA